MLLLPGRAYAVDTGKILLSSGLVLLGGGTVVVSSLWLASDNDCLAHDADGYCTKGYRMSGTDKALQIGGLISGTALIGIAIAFLLDSHVCVDCKETVQSRPSIKPSFAFGRNGAELSLRMDM
ncbi:MAG: hypothetical protein H6714_01675 [Myxococcales bacterium]|nr:hypothetical protein [Myxococcales bacterium]